MAAAALAAIPAVQALAKCLREAFESAHGDVRVVVGSLGLVDDDDFVLVAAPTESGAGVLFRPTPSDQGHQQGSTFDIVSLVSSYSAARDIEGRMARAQEILDLVASVVEDNATLDGTVAVADIGNDGQLATRDDENGCVVDIAFTVTCEIY